MRSIRMPSLLSQEPFGACSPPAWCSATRSQALVNTGEPDEPGSVSAV